MYSYGEKQHKSLSQAPGQAQPLTRALCDLTDLLLGAKSSLSMAFCIGWVILGWEGWCEAASSSPGWAHDVTDAAAQGAKEWEKRVKHWRHKNCKSQDRGAGDSVSMRAPTSLDPLRKIHTTKRKSESCQASCRYRHICALSAVAASARGWPRRGYKKNACRWLWKVFLLSVPQS